MNRAILFILSFLVMTPNVVLARVDFLQKYERGKIMLRRKLYFDAIKEFHVAVTQTEKGRRHFGVHYYLARAYYWLPDIQKAMNQFVPAVLWFLVCIQYPGSRFSAIRQILF